MNVLFALQEPGEINAELSRAGADTLDKVFGHVTSKHGDRDCLGTREILAEEDEPQPSGKVFKKYVLGQYNWISFSRFEEEASECGAGLRRLGLRSGDRAAILAETRADWMVAAYGCFQNGITIVTLYTNLGNDGVKHALNETEVRRTDAKALTPRSITYSSTVHVQRVICLPPSFRSPISFARPRHCPR